MRQGWFLWDNGIQMRGRTCPTGFAGRIREPSPAAGRKPLASQLEQWGQPSYYQAIAIRHTNPDHIGQCRDVPDRDAFVQKDEYERPGAIVRRRAQPEHPVTKLEGAIATSLRDGKNCSSSTPRHTPGHQSLLVKLRRPAKSFFPADAEPFQEQLGKPRRAVQQCQQGAELASMRRSRTRWPKGQGALDQYDKAQRDRLKIRPGVL